MRTAHVAIFVLLFAFALATASNAQNTPVSLRQSETVQLRFAPEDEGNPFLTADMWAVGLQAGLISGSGLGVRFHPVGRFGAQLVGGGIKLGDLTTYAFGVEGQFDFDVMGRSRFYGYVGTGLYYVKDKDEKKLDGPWRLGLGVAYEWSISRKLIFNASGAITYFSDGTVLPTPQLGLWYYFN